MDRDFSGRKGKRGGFAGAPAAVVCLAILLLFAISAAVSSTGTQEMPGEIVIDNKVYKTDRKGSVWFSHSDHADSYAGSCDMCHHEYKDGKNVWEEGQPVKKCFTCHDPNRSEESVKKLQIAFHKKCKGCHQKLAKEGGTNAPYKKCTDCHQIR